MGAEQVTCLLVLYAPGRHEYVFGVLWVDCDVIENGPDSPAVLTRDGPDAMRVRANTAALSVCVAAGPVGFVLPR